MAPRVHNSGHWTIEGAVTSQFENHLRAILGLPLGDARARGYSAMINLIGTMPARARVLGHAGVHLHDYAKKPRPGRKLGHLTVVEDSAQRCERRARRAAGRIGPRDTHPRRMGHCSCTLNCSSFGNCRSGSARTRNSCTLSKQHARAKAYMESTIWFTDGFVVITGEIGSGKTTLIESFLQEIQRDVVVAQICQTQVTVVDFLQSVLVQFGFSPFKMKKAELIATLNQFLVEQYSAGRKVLLIVDEAQNLSLKVLEEVRMLSGVETTKEKVLRIILAGQPELNHKLDAPELVQLTQRVRLRFHLGTLSAAEMQAYIHHRLEVAGAGDRQIFAEDTYRADLPLHRRGTATGQYPVRYRHARRLRPGSRSCAARGHPDFSAGTALAGMGGAAHHQERGVSGMGSNGLAASPNVPREVQHADPLIDTQTQGETSEPVGRVILATEGRTTQELPLKVGRIIIGRTADNDLQVDSRFVSRHHCQIITGAEGSMIEDLNSTNGIFVQGKRVRRYNLNDGDVVVIGKHEIMYVDERLARARTGSSKSIEESAAEAANENPAPGWAANRS